MSPPQPPGSLSWGLGVAVSSGCPPELLGEGVWHRGAACIGIYGIYWRCGNAAGCWELRAEQTAGGAERGDAQLQGGRCGEALGRSTGGSLRGTWCSGAFLGAPGWCLLRLSRSQWSGICWETAGKQQLGASDGGNQRVEDFGRSLTHPVPWRAVGAAGRPLALGPPLLLPALPSGGAPPAHFLSFIC